MKIQEFQYMNNTDKEEALWENAIFLGNYDEGNIICDAYELFDFYVALCYKLDQHGPAEITAHIYADQLPLMVILN